MIDKLYKILFLPKTERLGKLSKIIGNITTEEGMFLSLLIEIKLNGSFKVNSVDRYAVDTKNNLLLFMYHFVSFENLSLALSYLSEKEYKVVYGILKDTTFPTVELLEHIDTLYSTRDIGTYIRSRLHDPLFYSTTSKPTEYVIKGKSRVWSNITKGTNIPNNVIDLNGVRYNYTKEFKEYLLGDGVVFPIQLMTLPTETKYPEGTYTQEYCIKSHGETYTDFQYTLVYPCDWLVDANYEARGVMYEYNGKTLELVCDIDTDHLQDLMVKVFHTKRGKVVRSELVKPIDNN